MRIFSGVLNILDVALDRIVSTEGDIFPKLVVNLRGAKGSSVHPGRNWRYKLNLFLHVDKHKKRNCKQMCDNNTVSEKFESFCWTPNRVYFAYSFPCISSNRALRRKVMCKLQMGFNFESNEVIWRDDERFDTQLSKVWHEIIRGCANSIHDVQVQNLITTSGTHVGSATRLLISSMWHASFSLSYLLGTSFLHFNMLEDISCDS